ncbi:hypothetical protein L1F19_26805, partial [Pseudomonas juntendi]|uniref:hypothetical protein n=1 Tax=Pseudomonas juntendi TaxID=2666183 RepID=UPI001F223790
EHQAGCLALEFGGESTSLSAHRTPLCGDHFRLKRCPGLVDHYNVGLLGFDGNDQAVSDIIVVPILFKQGFPPTWSWINTKQSQTGKS